MGESLADIICQGGYPAAIARGTEKRRANWYRDYITALIQRDIQDIANIRTLDSLPRLLSLAATITQRDFKGLKKLRENCGKEFVAGVVLYDVDTILSFGENLYAVPLSILTP